MSQDPERDDVTASATASASASAPASASAHYSGSSLSVRWVQGFPSQNVHFVNDQTICYPSGNFVIFINLETKKKTVLQCINGIVGVMATNVPSEVVAFSDRRFKPVIYIYSFPSLTRKNKLKGDILLDYTLLCFSYCGTYLASYSSLPEFELALWNWEASAILCKKSNPGMDVSQMSFNPMNWHQMCLSSSSAMSVWTIERSNQEHHFRIRSVKLPLEDATFLNEPDMLFPTTLPKDLIYGPVLPLSAIAGLVGEEAETFRPKDDIYPLLHPTMHCWTPSSDLYVGCEEGHLLMINTETLKVTVLQKAEEFPLPDGAPLINPLTLVYQKDGILASGIDGVIYSFIIKDSKYQVKTFLEFDGPVTHLVFSPSYKMLLIQTDKGSVYIYTFGAEMPLDKLLDACDGKVQAVSFITPGTKYFLTLTSSGEVSTVSLEDCNCTSRIFLKTQATALACSPSSPTAAVGTVDGYVYFLNILDVESPQMIHQAFLSQSPVKIVTYDQRGIFLLVGTEEGNIFVIDARPSKSFQIFGFTETGKDILQISTVSVMESDVVEVLVLYPLPDMGRSRLEYFTLPVMLPEVVPENFSDERGRLKDDLTHKYLYEVEHTLSSAVLGFTGSKIFGFCSQVPYICSYVMPVKEHTGVLVLKPHQKVQSKQYGSGTIYLSSHGLWLMTIAKCGILCIRDMFSMETFVRCRSHSHQGRGIQNMKMSLDGQHILVNGKDDNTLVCLKWKRLGANIASEIFEHSRPLVLHLSQTVESESVYLALSRESTNEQQEETTESQKHLNSDSSEEEAVIDHKMIPWIQQKMEEAIKKEVRIFSPRRKEIKRGIKELAQVIAMMMEENEKVDIIAKLDEQEFCLDADELERLHDECEEEVAKIRKDVEMHNLAQSYLTELIKEECWNSMAVKGRALKCFHIPYVVDNFPMKERTEEELQELSKVMQQKKTEIECLKLRKEIVEVQATTTIAKKHHEEEEEEEEDEERTIKTTSLPNYLLGSLSTDFGADTSLLTSQLDLHSREEKINQIILLKISFKKYIAPWQRAKIKEVVSTYEMERLQQARISDERQRGLMDMMGGVLEVKKEDILRMVIPQPPFMAKADALWSEDERKQFKEYEKKVKELNEERDKYRKSLEAELKKLQNSIQESTQNFDDHLKRLFERRVKAEMVINQEELKINNIIFSLLLDEELSSREQFLNNYLLKKQEEKTKTAEAIQKAREDLDVFKEHHDMLVAEDKILDRSFKKEFSDILGHQVDVLYKLFKRRPRVHKQKTQADVTSLVPYGERPGSAKLNKENLAQLMKSMDELDNINNMPEGLDPSVWEHFCSTRRAKVENEYKVKQKAACLLEMTTFLRKRMEEDDVVHHEIEKVFHELIRLQDEKVRFQVNLTVQILLKQGQVELENFQLMLEYSDAILINKNIIEDLNSVIRTQGQKKVASMMESKEVHKGIYQIEWEHKKMEMEMEDLNQRAWDIEMLFFSRDRQKYLNEPNYENVIAIQIGIMEQTISVIDKTHKKNVENCKKLLKKLGKYSNQKDVANYTLSCNLREELVAVSERQDICNEIGSKLTCEKIARERYDNQLKQQKLLNISKQQAEQISILQAEVERLRMKTFPALIPM
ncbi:cilia- and flagella-associated protein 43 isoform X2 [Mus musculus]|uniref:cilia- and flagella-associated protein 43 isoform X2 n=1 Tax=Mus musculus TaxID=10090 RepID=UPI0003D6E17B|nr:cilia- and flagella-associated protein 43 isoform X2 [Mus musculus]|eukprot:XP_006526595.1 PREDICTED: cilia- and flagella-associated protein 43 isoform X2 [Mus musculus]